MGRIVGLTLGIFLFGALRIADAQELPPPPPPVEEAREEPPVVAPVVQQDAAALVDEFERAIELLIQGRFDEAAVLFERVAQQSVETERRAAAAELGRQSRARMGLAPAGVGVARKSTGEPARRPSGRAQYLGSTIVTGLNYGWMVPYALGVDDGKAFVGLYLLTAGGSFVAPYLITKEHEITKGMALLGGSGGLLGAGHGALLYGALAGVDGFDDIDNSRPLVATMLGASILEGASAYWWAKSEDISAARASSMTWGSLWGTGLTGLANIFVFADDADDQVAFGSMLTGAIAGTYGGYLYDAKRAPAEGNVQLVSYGGLLGAYSALAVTVVAELDGARETTGPILAGALGGLYLGDHLLDDRQYSSGQGGVVVLGSIAGGLLGAGVAFLVTPEDVDFEKTLVPGSAIGALAGYGLMRMAIPGSAGEADDGPVSNLGLSPILGQQGQRGLALGGQF